MEYSGLLAGVALIQICFAPLIGRQEPDERDRSPGPEVHLMLAALAIETQTFTDNHTARGKHAGKRDGVRIPLRRRRGRPLPRFAES